MSRAKTDKPQVEGQPSESEAESEEDSEGEIEYMIKERFLSVSKWTRSGKRLSDVRGVVVHYVGCNNQRAEQTRAYFESLKDGRGQTYASAHYIIDLDGEGLQVVPNYEVCWHCGADKYRAGVIEKLGHYPNYTTIGIEMCHTEEGFTEETIETATTLVANLLLSYNLTLDDLWRHYDITGKLCPKFFVDDESLWLNFKSIVDRKMR